MPSPRASLLAGQKSGAPSVTNAPSLTLPNMGRPAQDGSVSPPPRKPAVDQMRAAPSSRISPKPRQEQTKRFAYAPEKRLLPDEVVAQAASHEHVETVAAGLHHDSVRVRQAAALALGSLGLRGATHAGALAALMKDSDPGVRRAAAIALGNLGKLAADQEEVLQQASASDADDDVRFHAAVALGIVQATSPKSAAPWPRPLPTPPSTEPVTA